MMRSRSCPEQRADTFAVMNAANGFSKERRDRDDFYLLRKCHGLRFDRIRHQKAPDRTRVEALHRALTKNSVGHGRVDGLCAALDELVRRLGKGTDRDREVIDDQRGLSLHLSYDLQGMSPLIVCLPMFEDHG